MLLKRNSACAPVRNSSLKKKQMTRHTTYKLNVIYPSRSTSYFLNTSVIRLSEMHACTNRSKLSTRSLTPSSPRPRDLVRANVLNSNCTNCGLRRYPKATRASSNSRRLMLPLRSVSKRSKRARQAARKPQSPQNSSKLIVPLRSVSNIRIIILTGPEAVAVVAVSWRRRGCGRWALLFWDRRAVVVALWRRTVAVVCSPIVAIEVVGHIDRSVGRVSDVRSCRSRLAVAGAELKSHSYPAEAVNRMQPAAAELTGHLSCLLWFGVPAMQGFRISHAQISDGLRDYAERPQIVYVKALAQTLFASLDGRFAATSTHKTTTGGRRKREGRVSRSSADEAFALGARGRSKHKARALPDFFDSELVVRILLTSITALRTVSSLFSPVFRPSAQLYFEAGQPFRPFRVGASAIVLRKAVARLSN
ncbi:hypothetical protein KC349_g229 [Hortaea werneckii]|nr:hypothetical protein KC349_g229 [Hortaea werneckii]